MKHNLRRIIPVLFLVLVIAAAAWWYFGTGQAVADEQAPLAASGTIEATQVDLAPEIGGRVLEVLVDEGDAVETGQVLVRFEDRLLLAQRDQAQAALELAQANYDLVAAGPTAEQRRVAIAAAELELENARQTLDNLYDTQDLASAQADQAVALAEKAVNDAQRRLRYLLTTADQTDIDVASAEVALAEKNLERAQDAFEPYANKPEDNLKRAQLLSRKAAAEQQYDAAVRKLNALEGTGDELDIAVAEADLELARSQLDEAIRLAGLLADGPDPDAVALSRAQVAVAQAHLEAARAEPSSEQLAVAQAQVSSARAALNVIKAQLDKQALVAPIDGVVLVRAVEPGEVVTPGAALISIAHLDDLSITVYVPEDRYGQIRLGQEARVSVDSFPGRVFSGTVAYIADQAEFTPRNVQTAEGRRTTVFAVRIDLADDQDGLKPSMPAEVSFE